MTFEPVLMIWDFYDSPRSGLAHYRGQPHYFKCLWDKGTDDYSDRFVLSPVDASFVKTTKKQWAIYRDWEIKFHTGLVLRETHPGYRGVNVEYDQLDDEIKSEIKNFNKLPDNFIPNFRPLPNQDDLPNGVLRELEASWKKSKFVKNSFVSK